MVERALATVRTALNHYGFPTVWVDRYETLDRYGDPVMVDRFYQNGGLVTCEGFRIKKNGAPYARMQVLAVHAPDNVLAELRKLQGK